MSAWSEECGVWSGECEVWRTCGAWIVECGEKCGRVSSVKCGMWSVERGVESEERRV